VELLTVGRAVWDGLVNGVGYALFASGLTLIFGILLVVNFAHGELYMVGAILCYVVMTFLGVNFFLAAFIAITSVAAFGVIINRIAIQPLIERPGWATILATIGIGLMMQHGALGTLGPSGYLVITPFTGITYLGGLRVATESIVLLGIGSAAIVALHLFLRRAKIGKDMRATIQNPVGARLCAIDTRKVYDITFAIGSGVAALAGVLSAVLYNAHSLMGGSIIIKGFVVTIAAGMGNLVGACILGIVIGLAESMFSMLITPFFRETFIYGILVVVLLFRPEGFFAGRSR